MHQKERRVQFRVWVYLAVMVCPIFLYMLLWSVNWQSSSLLHTVVETAATLLALFIGTMALIHYYSSRQNIFLILGAGFIGTGLLDGYHAIVTSLWLQPYFPSELASLAPWSWIASRLFLSVILFFSWFLWYLDKQKGVKRAYKPHIVFSVIGVMTLISFLVFAFIPVPRAYFPEFFIHRPAELLPAVFFLAALVGYIFKGDWRHNIFENWLVLSLIVNFGSQTVFVSFSNNLFDMESDIAHFMKQIGYLFVLTGLFLNMLKMFNLAEKSKQTQKALQLSEERWQFALEGARDGLWDWNTKTNKVFFSRQWKSMLGFNEHEIGDELEEWSKRVHIDDRQKTNVDLEKHLSGETHYYQSEHRVLCKDGTYKWILDRGKVVTRDQKGQPLRVIGTHTDISKLKQIENDLKQYASALENLQKITAEQNVNFSHKILDILKLGCEVFNLPLGIVSHIKNDIYTIMHVTGPESESLQGAQFLLGETYCAYALEADGPIGVHHVAKSKLGAHPCYEKFALEAYICSAITMEGRRYGTLNFSGREARDRSFSETELRLIQLFAQIVAGEILRHDNNQKLVESNVRQRTVMNNIVDGLITIDDKGIIESFNPAAERIFDYKASEMIGKSVNILMGQQDAKNHDQYIRKYIETNNAKVIGSTREVEGMRKDGTVFPLELAVSEMRFDNKIMFTGVIRDITERKKIERMKAEFISTVSHELRTPLTSIQGSLGLIASGAAGKISAQARPLLNIAHRNCQRLIVLINDLLDMEKIASGKMQFNFKPFVLQSLVKQAIENNAAYADEFNVHYQYVNRMPDVSVNVDSGRFQQVMSNLLSNAAKFSPDGAEVEVGISPQGDMVKISVSDHGKGIPDEFREQVFKKFSQADSSDTRQKGGTGLGLSIAKAIVERMHGQIGFESEVGVGSTFYFNLPDYDKEIANISSYDKHKVLLACDDFSMIDKLKSLLGKNGFQVDVKKSLFEAESALKNNKYSAMALDFNLLDQDKLEFIRGVRTYKKTASLPIIAISKKIDQEQVLFGGEVSLIDWLPKSFDDDLLISTVYKILGDENRHTKKILHVEDDRDILRVISSVGGDIAKFDSALTLKEANAKLSNEDYDLVLLDISLPDGSGWELLPSIQAKAKQPKIIVFSADHISPKRTKQIAASLVKSQTSNQQLLQAIRDAIYSSASI